MEPTKMTRNRRYEGETLIGKRHWQSFLCFFCLSISYAMRVNLSVALVAMKESYDWGERERAFQLSSFFWGYIVTQVPGGQIAQRYGAKMILFGGVTTCSVLTLFTPLAVSLGGWRLLCLLRVLEGLAQGSIHPAVHAMLAKWAPVDERGTLGTISYSGAQFGTVIMLFLSGYIAESFVGWQGIFILPGLAGLLWAVFWCLFAVSEPAQHKTISAGERKYIENSLGETSDHGHHQRTPWRHIFSSPPFLSLLVVHCTHMWGFWTLLTQIPSYLKHIYDVDVKSSAALSALPYTAMLLLSLFFAWLSQMPMHKSQSDSGSESASKFSLAFSRKFFNTVGHWVPAISLVALGYVPKENAGLAVGLLTLTVGINAATYVGFQVNHIDLSPNYAGTLMGLTNGAANVMSALAPLSVGMIVHDQTSVVEWRLVFFSAAIFYFFGNLLFLIFGRADVQPWNAIESRALRQDPEPGLTSPKSETALV